jgi:hypothetical protein
MDDSRMITSARVFAVLAHYVNEHNLSEVLRIYDEASTIYREVVQDKKTVQTHYGTSSTVWFLRSCVRRRETEMTKKIRRMASGL